MSEVNTKPRRYGQTLRLTEEALNGTAFDLWEHAELDLIGKLARAVHKDGCQFDGWPKVTRIPLVMDPDTYEVRDARTEIGEEPNLWELRVTVLASPR